MIIKRKQKNEQQENSDKKHIDEFAHKGTNSKYFDPKFKPKNYLEDQLKGFAELEKSGIVVGSKDNFPGMLLCDEALDQNPSLKKYVLQEKENRNLLDNNNGSNNNNNIADIPRPTIDKILHHYSLGQKS